MNNVLRLWGLIGLCVVTGGCEPRAYEGTRRYALTGKIAYDGETVDAGTIAFLPMSDKQRVSGAVIENGTFSIPEEKGANEGTYRVEIRWAKRTGKQYYDGELKMNVDERKEALPARFHKKSDLTATVSHDHTHFEFDLKSQ